MEKKLDFSVGAFRRVAVPATTNWIRALVPEQVSGVYLLLADAQPIYVGRSDICLRSRLLAHGYLPASSHVAWEPCEPRVAFRLEAFWFHKLVGVAGVLNRVHPVPP